MTDEERESLLEEMKIGQAISLLEQHGFTVLEWQTGEPESGKIILAKHKTYDKEHKIIETYNVGKVSSTKAVRFCNCFYNQESIIKWAYLPEGGNNG